jgi:peptidoglycan/LPS O-acetylase OafA/YrhL
MRHTNDPDDALTGPAMADGLTRTRKAVLNVLVGVGFMIAVSGWLIRRRAGEVIAPPARGLHDGLLFALVAVAVASYLVRRGSRRVASLPPDRRQSVFYRTHAGSAAIAALGVPLGLAYGWFVDPSLEGVAPFWVVPMALGLLAIPRRGELEPPGGGDGREYADEENT